MLRKLSKLTIKVEKAGENKGNVERSVLDFIYIYLPSMLTSVCVLATPHLSFAMALGVLVLRILSAPLIPVLRLNVPQLVPSS